MKTPPFLLGAALLFWGWQCGLLPLAAILALVLEGSRLVKSRFELSPADFNRISDLCTLILIGMLFTFLASKTSGRAILLLLQWLPVTLLPLLIAQAYSTSEGIDISALFLLFRKKGERPKERPPRILNLTYPYFALMILSAGAANVRTPWFYGGLFSLSLWALWPHRAKRFSPFLWAGLLAVAGLSGYAGHLGLSRLQGLVESRTAALFSGFIRGEADPYRARTAIGDLGPLKLSDQILIRVVPKSGEAPPALLREGSFNVYHGSTWFALRAGFSRIDPQKDGMTWSLGPAGGEGRSVTITEPFRGSKGMLKLPPGVFEIAGLPVSAMQKSQFGAVRVNEGPGLISYRARFSGRGSLDGPPEPSDLEIPEEESPVITRIVQDLDLSAWEPHEIMVRLSSFFKKHFSYSLILEGAGRGSTALSHFLTRSRTGHCEYFATATVLLLRASGIPARYATGYAVQEYSPWEKRFVVRARHAHAWTLVYVGGAWHDFDTTPPSWAAIEQDDAPFFEPLLDFWSWFRFKFSEWRWGEGRERTLTEHAGWLLAPLVVILAWRLFNRRRVKATPKKAESPAARFAATGRDSEFYRIEKRMAEMGHPRHPWEPFSDWISRIEETPDLSCDAGSFRALVGLHYRYRFDPKGISPEERSALESGVRRWLERHPD